MAHGFKVLTSGLIVSMFVLAACGSPAAPAAPPTQAAPSAPPVAAPTQAAPSTPAGASLSNPASVNCEKQGGKLTIEKRGDGGEFGVCWFEDARQCEEWALMRGECPAGGVKVTGYGPHGRYCAITGGQYAMTGGDMTNEKGTCTFKNGKTCDGADYFDGKCIP